MCSVVQPTGQKTATAGRGRFKWLVGVGTAVAAGLGLIWLLQSGSPPVTSGTPEPIESLTVPQKPTPQKSAQPTDQMVAVRVSGLGSKSAAVMVAVFLDVAGFPDVNAADTTTETLGNGDVAEIELKLPLSGMAAVAVFQDLDGNGVLTKNVVGLPMEPYGFSRNARATFGPPKFEAAAVDLSTVSEPLQISVR